MNVPSVLALLLASKRCMVLKWAGLLFIYLFIHSFIFQWVSIVHSLDLSVSFRFGFIFNNSVKDRRWS